MFFSGGFPFPDDLSRRFRGPDDATGAGAAGAGAFAFGGGVDHFFASGRFLIVTFFAEKGFSSAAAHLALIFSNTLRAPNSGNSFRTAGFVRWKYA